MKPLIIFLILCAIAVGISVAAVGQQGYVLFFIPPATEIKMSLNAAIPLAVGLFFLLYVLIHFLKMAVKLPGQVRGYRENRRKNHAQADLQNAVVAMIEGRYDQAVHLAEKSLEASSDSDFNRLIAARSVHHLNEMDKRDAWFAQAVQSPELKNAVEISRAALLTDAGDPEGVETAIGHIDVKDRSRLAHRLLVKAYVAQQKWTQLLEFLRDFGRRGDRNKEQVAELKREAQRHILADAGLTKAQMDVMWHLTPDDERTDPVILLAFAQCAVRLGDYLFVRRQVESFLERDWDGQLVRLYGSFLDPDAEAVQLERLEAWQQQRPDDADLQFALGRLCTAKQLWGKAEEYLESSQVLKPCDQTRLALAQLFDKTGRPEKATEIYRQIAQVYTPAC